MIRLALLFTASGAVALIVETTWLRWLRLVFGATAPAASATLVAFFTGHAVGAALAARWVPRWRRPLRAYGVLELAAAAGALAAPLLLAAGGRLTDALYDGLRDEPVWLALTRYGVALAATLPASLCFGATLPAIGAAAVSRVGELGRRGTALYAWNTLGAAAGTALASFGLPEWIGVRGSYGAAIALGVGVGVLAWHWGGRAPARTAPEPRPTAAPSSPVHPGLLAVSALSGFLALGGQVLWINAFGLVFNQSVYAFGSVLVIVLAALAAGSALVSALEARGWGSPDLVARWGLVAVALLMLGFPAGFSLATGGLHYVGSDAPWPGYLGVALGTAAATAGPVLLAASLLLPACLALAGRDAEARGAHPGSVLGRLSAANTVGAIAGAVASPFLLLPTFGPWGAFAFLAALAGAGALVWREPGPRWGLRAGVLAAGALGLVLLAPPWAVSPVRVDPGERLLSHVTTASGSVAVVERADGLVIRTDNHYSLGGSAGKAQEERQGHLPLLLHPSARSVAYVGTATAITAGAATAHPVERIHLVEIVPAVSDAAQRFFADFNRRVHADRRSVVVLDDARNFLGSTDERFDVVVADLFVPWRSGTGALYTREHFEAVRARLAPDGLFCQWLPLYQLDRRDFEIVVATFLDVFLRSGLFRGDFFGAYPIAALVGWAGEPASPQAVSAAARRLGRAGITDRWVTDDLGVWALAVGGLAPLGPQLADVPRNTDDWPRIEFRSARAHRGSDRGLEQPFVGLDWAAFAEAVRLADRQAPEPLYHLPLPAERAREGGSWLQRAGAHYVAREFDASSHALARAASRLPGRLLADADADPTAAEVWHTRR